jgi:hypothetical protein
MSYLSDQLLLTLDVRLVIVVAVKVRHVMVIMMTASASPWWHASCIGISSTNLSATLLDSRTNYDSNDRLRDKRKSPSENSSHFLYLLRARLSSVWLYIICRYILKIHKYPNSRDCP